jgi:hypothetical protein
MVARFHARAAALWLQPLLLFLAAAASLASSACGSSGGSGTGSSSGSSSGSGSGGVSPPFADGGVAVAPPCPLASLPSTLHLTVSGFTTCTCFNGTFTLTQAAAAGGDNPPVWSSQPITGCPGQQDTAYLKFSSTFTGYYDPADGDYVVGSELGIGITDQESDPDDGNSDYSPATSVACSPFAASGGGSTAGNIDSFCPGVEDEGMKWTLGP